MPHAMCHKQLVPLLGIGNINSYLPQENTMHTPTYKPSRNRIHCMLSFLITRSTQLPIGQTSALFGSPSYAPLRQEGFPAPASGESSLLEASSANPCQLPGSHTHDPSILSLGLYLGTT